MKDERLTDCPLESCDGQVKRLLGTGAGIIFKGSGFYETDYRSASYKKAASADKPSDSSSSSSGGSSGESKPASTTSTTTGSGSGS
jgi:predicted nucleic acid-binding Zn ribbon protein